MNIWANYIASWQQIFNYHGKTRRRDFWAAIIGMVIASVIVSTLLSGTSGLNDGIALPARWLENFFFLAQFLQYLSMSVRRLHSLGLSGNYQWLMLLPGVHMIVLHALPETERDSRAPWYHMINANNEPGRLEVDRHGHVNGILGNAFGYTWRNFFNFRDTVSRGNYLWARVAWSIFCFAAGAILFLTIFVVVLARVFISMLASGTNVLQLVPNTQGPTIDPSMLNGIGLYVVPIGIALLFITMFPVVSLTARRLHDQELSAWWVFLYLAGSIGSIILLLLTLLPAKDDQTKYPAADGLSNDENQKDFTQTNGAGQKDETNVASNAASVEVFYPQSAGSSDSLGTFPPTSSASTTSSSADSADSVSSEDRDDHV
ncbi:MAG TPA: hypothetical protein DCW31_11705 [Lactobacillus sp.]|nr:hypothetical protein [Lactobacillus sp.]